MDYFYGTFVSLELDSKNHHPLSLFGKQNLEHYFTEERKSYRFGMLYAELGHKCINITAHFEMCFTSLHCSK